LKKIGIVVKPDIMAEKNAFELEKWLKAKNIEVVLKMISKPELNQSGDELNSAPSDLFCIFVLGGDGTFLSAARWIRNQNIPIIGVKFGNVGFMAEITEDNLFIVAEDILNNRFSIEPRMRLQAKVIRDENMVACETILNDIVINKGALARLAHITTYINEQYLTSYRSDGLIVSTPTGSTAYSLAAGGPIIHPVIPGIIMTPICPFTLTNRPLMVPENVCIKIKLAKKSSDIMLTFDGQKGLEIDERDTIIVEKSNHPINMIKIEGQNYYDVLKTKLKWSGSRN
jgi:NAD+ kinase